jgi:hypothetical protein
MWSALMQDRGVVRWLSAAVAVAALAAATACNGQLAGPDGGGADGGDDGGVRRCAVAGALPVQVHEEQLVLPTWGAVYQRAVLDGRRLYWVNGPSIMATALPGGPSDPYSMAEASELSVASGRLWFSTRGPTPTLAALSSAGGAPEIIASLALWAPFAIGGDTAFFVDEANVLRARPSGGGAATALLTLTGEAHRVAVDDADVFVASADGGKGDTIVRLPRGGGVPTGLVADREIVRQLTASGGNVVWQEGAAGDNVWQVRKAGGAPTRLHLADGHPLHGLTIRGDYVYFTDASAGQILRVPMSGGTPEVLASRQWQARGLAVDADCIFWLSGDPPPDAGGAQGGAVHVMATERPLP